MSNLNEEQIKNLNVEISKVLGMYVEFTEEEQRNPRENEAYLKSTKMNQNLGIFGRCFYDVYVNLRLFKTDEGEWVGEPGFQYEYHDGGRNGANIMMWVKINDSEVTVIDRMNESWQNRRD